MSPNNLRFCQINRIVVLGRFVLTNVKKVQEETKKSRTNSLRLARQWKVLWKKAFTSFLKQILLIFLFQRSITTLLKAPSHSRNKKLILVNCLSLYCCLVLTCNWMLWKQHPKNSISFRTFPCLGSVPWRTWFPFLECDLTILHPVFKSFFCFFLFDFAFCFSKYMWQSTWTCFQSSFWLNSLLVVVIYTSINYLDEPVFFTSTWVFPKQQPLSWVYEAASWLSLHFLIRN